MADWFARAVLHVSDVEASLVFYVERLGFTVDWRVEWDGRAHVAEVDRQGCALILSDEWPEKAGKALIRQRAYVVARASGQSAASRARPNGTVTA